MKHIVVDAALMRIVVLAGLTLLPGCSWLTRPMEKPVIEDNMRINRFQDSKVGILSLSPERRTVLYSFESKRYCAENPTEVGIDMSSASRLAADLKEAGSPLFGAQVALSAASNNYVLNRRSPGIILYQSSSYQFCQMYANDAISKEEFQKLQLAALNSAEKILMLETTAIKEIRVEEEKRRSAEESRRAEAEKADREMEKLKKDEADKAKKEEEAKARQGTSGATATTTTTLAR